MSTDPTPSDAGPSFEQALERLEAIVHALEDGEIGLGESLEKYEEGVKLLRHCHTLLERVERRIELVTAVDAEGRAVTEPFDDSASFSSEAPRGKARGQRPGPRPEGGL